jgi:branched-chain amino acid transport system ATP-binding protein
MLEVDKIDIFHGEIQALWQVSLKIEAGELVSLIGANGAGKSTIVESISGLLPLAGGSIRFDGVNLAGEGTSQSLLNDQKVKDAYLGTG